MDLIFESETAKWYRTNETILLDKWMREESPINKRFTKNYNAYLVYLKNTKEEIYVFRTRDDKVIECKTLRELQDCAAY